MNTSYVVTTKAMGWSQSRIWLDSTPMGIGYPIHWVLEKTPEGLRVRNVAIRLGKSQARACQSLSLDELSHGVKLKLNKIDLSVRVKNSLEKGYSLPIIKLESEKISEKNFLKSLMTSGVGISCVLILSWIWGVALKPPPEVIPVQYTKIIFSKPKGVERGFAQSSRSLQTKKASSKPLGRAVSSLLKGGMTKLLVQSLRGFSFDKKTDLLRSGGLSATVTEMKAITVAGLGGEAGSNGVEKIGYRQGGHAIVAGQGKAQVSLDTQGSAVEEGLTKDEVGEVIHHHLSEVRYCYESTMLKTPDLEGKLIIQFKIGELGAIKTAAIQTSSLPDPRLDDCVLRRLVTWKFPTPKGGIDVAVTYPFIFKTLGR